jgi:hypothetical protein
MSRNLLIALGLLVLVGIAFVVGRVAFPELGPGSNNVTQNAPSGRGHRVYTDNVDESECAAFQFTLASYKPTERRP